MTADQTAAAAEAAPESVLTDAERKNLLDAKDGLLDRDLVAFVEGLVTRHRAAERRATGDRIAQRIESLSTVDVAELPAMGGYTRTDRTPTQVRAAAAHVARQETR